VDRREVGKKQFSTNAESFSFFFSVALESKVGRPTKKSRKKKHEAQSKQNQICTASQKKEL
jgi:hypothetical protein